MIALIRLAILLLTRRWGLIVVGVVLVLVGLIMGASSHQVSYRMGVNPISLQASFLDGEKKL